MGAGGARESILTWVIVIVLLDVEQKTSYTIGPFQNEALKGLGEELSEGEVPDVTICYWRKHFRMRSHIRCLLPCRINSISETL